MTKLMYAALIAALTSGAVSAQTTVTCDSGDQFCTDTNTMLQSVDTLVSSLQAMQSSDAQLQTDITNINTLIADLQSFGNIGGTGPNACPTTCTPSTCDVFCSAVVGYYNQLQGDAQTLTNDQQTTLADIGTTLTMAQGLQKSLQADFQTVLNDLTQAETDLGAVCAIYGGLSNNFNNLCTTPAGMAAKKAFDKKATAEQKAKAAAARKAAVARSAKRGTSKAK